MSSFSPTCAALDERCDSCGADLAGEDESCPGSQKPCGHHCNHSWSHDECCWCDKKWNEEDDEEMS